MENSLGFKVGDIITAYKKGYHECISITEREQWTPLVEYVPLYNAEGKPINAKRKSDECDAGYCRLAKDVAKELLETAQTVYDLLK